MKTSRKKSRAIPEPKAFKILDKYIAKVVETMPEPAKAPFYLGNSPWSEKVLSARDREFLHEEAEEAQLVADLWKEPRGLLIVACNKAHFDRFRNKLGQRGQFENVVHVDRRGDAMQGCDHVHFRLVLLPNWQHGHDHCMDRYELDRAIFFFESYEHNDKKNPPVLFNPKSK